jgi:beta-fructofuranosidase
VSLDLAVRQDRLLPLGMIELLTILWLFKSAQMPQSVLTSQLSHADFAAPANTTNGFTVKMRVGLKRFAGEKQILDVPEVLGVVLRQHNPSDRTRQNYPAFKMSDGSTPVLEATLRLHSTEHSDWKNMTVGIPLAMLKHPTGEHEIVLNFSGVRWTLYVDGELLDNDFPFGYPRWPAQTGWKIDPQFVSNAEIDFPALTPLKQPAPTRKADAVQYWTPPGHNAWVGDVATLFYQGRYHLFYLYDRRHHQSKFGKGAHYFEHLSTSDFKTWIEHEAATPLDEQWECIGTGTPFVFNQQLCLSYGLHTTRVYPREATTLPAQWDYLKKNGQSGSFPQAATPGFPAGSTYATSTDGGGRFQKSKIMFHPCENPSVYTDPRGKLRMLANFGAKGMWESESIDGGWRCVNPDFPPGGDCTFFFRWGRFDYIVGGFTGLWSKSADAPDSAYQDLVRQGLDFYDGSNVPSIARVKGGRFLMAAWIPIGGWGGPLVIRELVQLDDGRIGSKWMKEITPATGRARTLSARIAELESFAADHSSFMLNFDVRFSAAKSGRLAISFFPESGGQSSCELQIEPATRRAQFATATEAGFAARQKSLREGGAPHQVGDYAIENLSDVERPFPVRLLVKTNDKIGGSLIDAEIAGKRTMISYRAGLTAKRLVFRTEGVELKNVRIAPLKE